MEILQAPLEVGHPVEFSSGEAKVCMLLFYIFGSMKIYMANEPGCVQITSLTSALEFAYREKKVLGGGP